MKGIYFKANLVVISLIAVTQISQASLIYGLSKTDQIVSFDSSTPGTLTSAVFVNGLQPNETLLGFDFRPADQQLYGVGSFGRIYRINPNSGAATFVSSIFNGTTSGSFTLSGTDFGVDFNPVANRLRVISNIGQNLRINVDTGATTVDGTINQVGATPSIVASGYTNNFAGATTTALYNLDYISDQLKLQTPPNDGTQTVIGSLGYDITSLAGLDIVTQDGVNTAYASIHLDSDPGSKFATINLLTGAATIVGNVGLETRVDAIALRDIAAAPVPEPASILALTLGIAALARKKRRA